MYDQLKQDAKNEIFAKQMAFSMAKRLDEMKNAHNQAYSEQVNKEDYYYGEMLKVKKFEIAGDDATLRPKMWASLATDVAFYYDNPTLAQEALMKKTLQYRYDSLFKAGWRPPLQSRRDLMEWACSQ